jgi:hypothetical protein
MESDADGGPDARANRPAKRKRTRGKLVGIGLALAAVVVVARFTGLSGYVSLDGLDRLRDWIDGFGAVAPLVFVAIYVMATVAFCRARRSRCWRGWSSGRCSAPCGP